MRSHSSLEDGLVNFKTETIKSRVHGVKFLNVVVSRSLWSRQAAYLCNEWMEIKAVLVFDFVNILRRENKSRSSLFVHSKRPSFGLGKWSIRISHAHDPGNVSDLHINWFEALIITTPLARIEAPASVNSFLAAASYTSFAKGNFDSACEYRNCAQRCEATVHATMALTAIYILATKSPSMMDDMASAEIGYAWSDTVLEIM
jgi:hypothetical protein